MSPLNFTIVWAHTLWAYITCFCTPVWAYIAHDQHLYIHPEWMLAHLIFRQLQFFKRYTHCSNHTCRTPPAAPERCQHRSQTIVLWNTLAASHANSNTLCPRWMLVQITLVYCQLPTANCQLPTSNFQLPNHAPNGCQHRSHLSCTHDTTCWWYGTTHRVQCVCGITYRI